MIKGMHGLFYTTEPEAARAFLRDKLRLPAYDSGGGWLIFEAPGDFGCHPSDRAYQALSFSCDDLDATMAELRGRGVTFSEPVVEGEWGRVTSFDLPGGGPIQLYQPKYHR